MAATKGLLSYLSMAACEWFLMTLMFIDAALACILTKFANYCELETPCLFCYRFLGSEEPKPYLSLFCSKHRAEISHLMSCDLHDKLVDIREVCNDCFTSSLIQNESNSDFDTITGDQNDNLGACSCCESERKTRSSPQRFVDSKVPMKPPVPFVADHGCVIREDNFKNATNNTGYPELKFNSDSFFGDNNPTPATPSIAQNQDPNETEHLHNVSDPAPSLQDTHNDENTTNNASTAHESVPQEVKERETIHLEVEKDTHIENDLSNAKNDGYESPSVSSVSEIEGESVVDRLKRQVRLLQAELEEERNAADTSANEAMAMITRLQEEKSSLHTEALQYLRMVEEQAEYDMETLDKANDLVDQKDKEIQDLEAELEYLRSRYDNEQTTGNNNNNHNKNMVESETSNEEHMGNGKIEKTEKIDKIETNSSSTSKFMKVLDFEDEKRYILLSLSELESKFHQLSKLNGNGTQSNGTNRVCIDGVEIDVGTIENEISDLHERLDGLEADKDFLEHACNVLQGNGGFKFIHEIAQQLQDLRKVRFERR